MSSIMTVIIFNEYSSAFVAFFLMAQIHNTLSRIRSMWHANTYSYKHIYHKALVLEVCGMQTHTHTNIYITKVNTTMHVFNYRSIHSLNTCYWKHANACIHKHTNVHAHTYTHTCASAHTHIGTCRSGKKITFVDTPICHWCRTEVCCLVDYCSRGALSLYHYDQCGMDFRLDSNPDHAHTCN